jgi:nucleoside-diphosphate-sugar epimerase
MTSAPDDPATAPARPAEAHALVVGASGITGTALIERLSAGGWEVSGLSRRAVPRDIEVLADMSKSRLAGFPGYVRTEDAFLRLFDRYRADRLIPGSSVAGR